LAFGKLGGLGRGEGKLGAPLGGASGYNWVNPEAQAVAAAFTTPPTNARKSLIDNWFTTVKAAGALGLLDAMYMLAAADNQAARINWKAPASYTLSPVNSPAFAVDRGYTGDGSSSYLDTGFNAATAGGSFSLNSGHQAIFSRTDGAISTTEFGTINNRLFARTAANQFSGRMMVNSITTAAASLTGIGHFCMSRTISSSFNFFFNGGTPTASADASSSLTPANFWIGASSSTGSFSTRQIAGCHFGAGLTQAQNAAIYNATLSYLQAVGAA
jgi:hypothetical protein